MPDPTTISEGMAALWAASQAVVRAEAALALAQAEKERLETRVLPEIFRRERVKEATHENGAKAKIATKMVGSLPKADQFPEARQDCLDWFVQQGHADAIKVAVTAKWGRGEREAAIRAYEQLRGDNSAAVDMTESIHPQTYQKIIHEHIKAGGEADLTMLGVELIQRVSFSSKAATMEEGNNAANGE